MRQRGGVRCSYLVAPKTTGVQYPLGAEPHIGIAVGAGQCGSCRTAIAVYHVDDIGQGNVAAARGDGGVHVDLAGGQAHVAAGGDVQVLLHGDAAGADQIETAEALLAEAGGVQPNGAEPLAEFRVPFQFAGDILDVTDAHVAVEAAAQAEQAVLAEQQLAGAGDAVLCLAVAVQALGAGAVLTFAVVDFGDDVALQDGGGRADDQPPGVTTGDVAVFQALFGVDQRVAPGVGLAPAFAGSFVAPIKPGIAQVARRGSGVVEVTVGAFQPGLANIAGLHVKGAAGQVDGGAALGNHRVAVQPHGAAGGGPLASGVRHGVEIAAHFQQAAGGVPAVGFIAAGAGGHVDQFTAVDPDVAVAQRAAVAVDRGIALFVALYIDQDVVGFHRHAHADGAGHIQLGAAFHAHAVAGGNGDLAAGGLGERVVLEDHVAAGDDLHAGLVAAVGQLGQVVEDAVVETLALEIVLR